jgi:putative Mg2+ transporter-C (MgtC) family protein
MTFDPRHLLDILIAYALAFPLGLERERSEHTAGIRTFPLVAIATCAFLIGAEGLKKDYADVVSRVLQGVVAGMGFIGGGAILKTGDMVYGTATAAGLWATAAIGACVAMHSYDIAIALSVLSFVTLHVLKRFTHEPEAGTPRRDAGND